MPYAELSTVQHRLQLGAPLPFNVRDANHTLLLARGHRIETREQLEALMQRGALVDMTELQSARDQILKAPRELLPQLWSQGVSGVACEGVCPSWWHFAIVGLESNRPWNEPSRVVRGRTPNYSKLSGWRYG